MKYLKYFETEAEYTAYKNGSDYVLPNVSYVEEINNVDYNPIETILVCTVNVTDTTSATKVCNKTSGFTSMEVDGVLQDTVTTEYAFDTVGEHTVKFELADTTSIGAAAFQNCTGLTSIVIPNTVTSIGAAAFRGCSSLTSITIPDSVISIGDAAFNSCSGLTSIVIPYTVTSIGNNTFQNCTGLTEITCLATTAPSNGNNTFQNVKSGGILKVPVESDYSSWMRTANYYLGKYNWTIEYI